MQRTPCHDKMKNSRPRGLGVTYRTLVSMILPLPQIQNPASTTTTSTHAGVIGMQFPAIGAALPRASRESASINRLFRSRLGVNSSEVSTTPIHFPKSEPSIELDQAVKVCKGKISRQHDQILRFPKVIRRQLDHFRTEDPETHV